MSIQILGDKKRIRYDEGLVDVVNRKAELGELGDIIEEPAKIEIVERKVIFDSVPFGGRMQKRFCEWNEWDFGDSCFASLSDFYQLFKRTVTGSREERKEGLNIRWHLYNELRHGFCTSTFFHERQVLHHYKCKDKSFGKIIPLDFNKNYVGINICTANNPAREKVLQAIFDTKDPVQEIARIVNKYWENDVVPLYINSNESGYAVLKRTSRGNPTIKFLNDPEVECLSWGVNHE